MLEKLIPPGVALAGEGRGNTRWGLLENPGSLIFKSSYRSAFTTLNFILIPLLFILTSSMCLERNVIGIDFGREKPFDQAFTPCPLKPPGAVTPMLAHLAGLEWGLQVLITYLKSGTLPSLKHPSVLQCLKSAMFNHRGRHTGGQQEFLKMHT